MFCVWGRDFDPDTRLERLPALREAKATRGWAAGRPQSCMGETQRGVGGEPQPKDPEVLTQSNHLWPRIQMTMHRNPRRLSQKRRSDSASENPPAGTMRHVHGTKAVISTDSKINTDKSRHSFRIKTLNKPGTKGHFLNVLEGVSNNPQLTARSASPPTSGTRRGRPPLPSIVLEVPDRATGQEKRQQTSRVERRT